MNYLEKLENESIYIIREAYNQIKDVALLWSIGKDSTTLLWLIRKAFYGQIPFPVIHIDTGYEYDEVYRYRETRGKEWGLNLIVQKNEEAIQRGICPEKGTLKCCTELKTNALKQIVKQKKLKALYLGIRRDEHGIRAKERYFSVRDEEFEWDYKGQAPELWGQYKTKAIDEEHIRVHPLLGWTELDIWRFIQKEQIPIIELYLAKNGKRFRSIGCAPCCQPINSETDTIEKIIDELQSTTTSERSGRAQDKDSEFIMQKLRSLGYM